MSKPATTRCCPYCDGTGRLAVTGSYLETLRILAAQRRPLNGAALAKLAKCKATAMNGRLTVLETFGLVKGERDGRQKLWTIGGVR